MKFPKHLCFFAAAILAAARPLATEAQSATTASPAPQRSGYILKVQRNEVLVDVRVYDQHGNPVTGLKQSDFKIFEDGKLQTISSFDLENVDQLSQATAASGASKIIDLSKLPANVTPAEAVQNRRMIVLFFDLTSMEVDDLMRALKSARSFIHTKLTAADLVSVVIYSSELRVLHDFTNDRDALDKALKSIQIGESSSLAQNGAEGDAGATNENGDTIVTEDTSAAFTPDETEFNIFNTDEKLSALESLADMLRGVPGRKSVIHFSSGIERTGIENQAQLKATEDAANRADVSFYMLDARGLAALPPGGDASTASPSGNAIYTAAAVSSQMSSLDESRETLAALSLDTGGRMFYDLNDFSSAFSTVQRDNSIYYLLGYSPSNTKADGRFRRIRVEVDRPGVKVQARPGYFAPKSFRQFTRQDKEEQLQQVMSLDVPFVDLPLVVETSHFLLPDKTYHVVLAAKIPGSAVSFLKKSDRHRTEFDFVWRVTDLKGHVVNYLRDTLPVKLEGEAYDEVLASNILYQGGIVLPPGQYKLKVVVRENESGKIGTFEEPLDLPPVSKSGMMLSSVVLSNQLELPSGARLSSARPRKSDPLQIGNRYILPSVTRVFRTNQNLYIYLESYASGNKKAADSQENGPGASSSVGVVFFRGGTKTAEAGLFPGYKMKPGSHKTGYFVKLPLDSFPPGRYWVQLNVVSPATGQVAFARVPMAIIKLSPAQVRASAK